MVLSINCAIQYLFFNSPKISRNNSFPILKQNLGQLLDIFNSESPRYNEKMTAQLFRIRKLAETEKSYQSFLSIIDHNQLLVTLVCCDLVSCEPDSLLSFKNNNDVLMMRTLTTVFHEAKVQNLFQSIRTMSL